MRRGRRPGVLALGLVLAWARPAQAERPCANPAAEGRERCAGAFFAAQEYERAAEQFEALWEETGRSESLFKASVAREAAGSDGWALAHAVQYSKQIGLTTREQEEADARVGELRRRLIPVPIVVTPSRALGVGATLTFRRVTEYGTEEFRSTRAALTTGQELMVWLERGDWSVLVAPASRSPAYARAQSKVLRVAPGERFVVALAPIEAPVPFVFGPGAEVRRGVDLRLIDLLEIAPERRLRLRSGERVALPIGPWRVRAEQRRLSSWTVQRDFVVEADEGGRQNGVELEWRLTQERQERRTRQIRVIQGLGGAAAGHALVGAVLLGVGLERVAGADHGPEAPAKRDTVGMDPADPSESRWWQVAGLGGGVLGVGVGLGLTGALEALKPSPTRSALTFTSGTGLTVVGVVWSAAAAYELSTEQEVKAGFAAGAGAVLGLGLGMIAGAAVGHIVRRGDRARAEVVVGSTGAGLQVQGRF